MQKPNSSEDPPAADERIETPRLILVSLTTQMMEAEGSPERLGLLTGTIVPGSWPPPYWDRHAIAYLKERFRRYPESRGWTRYVAVRQAGNGPPVLAGGCGCTDPPETAQDVEIGYSLLPEYQGSGYATEALQAFLPWVFRHPNVRSVCAQTYPHLAASIGVLRRCGFRMDGTGKDPGTVLFRLHRP